MQTAEMPALPIHSAGGIALQAARSLVRGRVTAVFRRSLYVEGPGDRWLCLGPPALGRGPLNLLCDLPEGLDWSERGLRVGTPAASRADRLHVGQVSFGLETAAEWWPDPAPEFDAAAMRRGLERLSGTARDRLPAEGCAPLLPLVIQRGARCENDPLRIEPEVAVLRAWLTDSIASVTPVPVPSELRRLIGLGPGLTPSGDDLLGGVLIVLHAFGFAGAVRTLANWVRQAVTGRTHPISAAHLSCASHGVGSECLHRTLDCLATGAPDRAKLDGLLRTVDAIGHTSGWDALVGVSLACSVAAESDAALR